MARAILIVLDGLGVGGAPDADRYGDAGSDTLANMAAPDGRPDRAQPGRPWAWATCTPSPAWPPAARPLASWGRLQEVSAGKDSTTGHWELMGLVTAEPFPTYPDGFPARGAGRVHPPHAAAACWATRPPAAPRSSPSWGTSTWPPAS